jgi:hypothetical protein
MSYELTSPTGAKVYVNDSIRAQLLLTRGYVGDVPPATEPDDGFKEITREDAVALQPQSRGRGRPRSKHTEE